MKRYSIAEARRQLPAVIDQARSGAEVQLTRRGEPVAVLVSAETYERLKGRGSSFTAEYAKFRARFPVGQGGVPRHVLRGARDRSPGRKVPL